MKFNWIAMSIKIRIQWYSKLQHYISLCYKVCDKCSEHMWRRTSSRDCRPSRACRPLQSTDRCLLSLWAKHKHKLYKYTFTNRTNKLILSNFEGNFKILALSIGTQLFVIKRIREKVMQKCSKCKSVWPTRRKVFDLHILVK